MTSGSYFPQATREVIRPKTGGGERRLGIPILLDRIAQQVVVAVLEPIVEKKFHADYTVDRHFRLPGSGLRSCDSSRYLLRVIGG